MFTKRELPGGTEAIGLLAAVVILLIAFGSVLAMGLPILTALFGIGVGFAIVELLSHATSVPEFATQLAAMIGIGVGIDYALFIVTRYRQGLHEGLDPETSVVTALDTAGRAVLFAGTTVVISLLGMLLIGIKFVGGLGVGRGGRRRRHHGGLDHAAAGPARLRRAQRRQVQAAGHRQDAATPAPPPATAGATSSSATPGPSPPSACSSSSPSPCRSSRSASAPPTRATPPPR